MEDVIVILIAANDGTSQVEPKRQGSSDDVLRRSRARYRVRLRVVIFPSRF